MKVCALNIQKTTVFQHHKMWFLFWPSRLREVIMDPLFDVKQNCTWVRSSPLSRLLLRIPSTCTVRVIDYSSSSSNPKLICSWSSFADKPFFKSCPDKLIVEENKFRMSQLQCETDGNPPPSVEWSHLGQKLTDLDKLFTRADSGVYRASVSNSVGQNFTEVLITVERGWIIPPSLTVNTHLDITCFSNLYLIVYRRPQF